MKSKNFKWLNIFAVLFLFISTILPYSVSATTIQGSDLVSVSKSVSIDSLVRGGQEVADVTLSVKGTPQETTFVQPNDVILIIDKSGSMQTDNRLAAAKDATKEFLDLIDTTKHRVGIVDYSGSVSSFPLTTDIDAAKAYVDNIELGGGTNTGDAIRQATAMLANPDSGVQPTIVILTDGEAQSTTDALASSKAAKDAGVIFYSIALLAANENPDLSAPNQLLKNMSTSADHHHFVLGSIGLPEVYRQIVEEIGLASAYNVVVTDTVSPEFEIVPGSYDNNIPKPTVNGNTLEWNITELKANELTFTYQVRLKDTATAGKIPLATTSTTFEDHEGNSYSVDATNPTIEITNPAPIINEIDANKGLTAGGETISIKGQNFLDGAKVYFGSKLATVSSISSGEIIVKSPSGIQGTTVEVKVVNTDGQFAVGQYSYYDVPTIISVSPAEGEMPGGNKITVAGTKFLTGAKVYINDVEAPTTFVLASKLYAIVPSSEISGTVSVKVINPDGSEASLESGYTYLEPAPPSTIELHKLSITSGSLKGGDKVTLYGQEFDENVKVYFGEIEATVDYYTSSSSIRVIVPAGVNPSLVTVKAVNPDGLFSELVNSYEYLAPPTPQLDSLSATSGKLAGGEKVIVYGANLDTDVKVYFGDQEAAIDYYYSSSRVRVIAPAGTSTGFVNVKVVNPTYGTEAVLTSAYEYLPPDPVELNSLSAASGEPKGGNKITLYGKNFDTDVKVYFGDQEAIVDYYTSSSSIRVIVPENASTGFVSVKVVNPDGSSAELIDGYEYAIVLGPTPVITSLSKTSVLVGESTSITIYGQNFDQKGLAYVDGEQVSYSWVTSTRVRISVPVSIQAKTVDIEIVNPDGQSAILPNGFSYEEPVLNPAPIISSLSSNMGELAGGETITISGQNFDSTTKVYFASKLATVISVTDTAIQVKVPSATTSTTVPVKVVNSDSQQYVLDNGYTYLPKPITITSLSTTSGSINGGTSVTIYGTNFTNKTMTISVAGEEVSYTYISATRIRINTPSTLAAGTVKITITDIAGREVSTDYTYY
ncbi:IPT/TIG domain-containing protein [Bacillus sp. AGMB 02131]|uniref:IPT/TIG domain-containing protein n=1 Tax=Peribacillus faecalis TaxID=2772559 RepID=A0A927CVQ3_9BACI|nr:IPT/TIG domain-containing protein [Peribacillus faecalis]MBD3108493.1 IPT/TIG domain-containing protein [Peribacillus faecalis]